MWTDKTKTNTETIGKLASEKLDRIRTGGSFTAELELLRGDLRRGRLSQMIVGLVVKALVPAIKIVTRAVSTVTRMSAARGDVAEAT